MNHLISLNQAKEMVALYRQQRKTILAPGHSADTVLAISETFDAEAVKAILAQSGCASVRIYYGMKPDIGIHAILVGVDAEGKDILPPAPNAIGGSGAMKTEGGLDLATEAEESLGTEDEVGIIIEEAIRCPQNCPPESELFP